MNGVLVRLESVPNVHQAAHAVRHGSAAGEIASSALWNILGHIPPESGGRIRLLHVFRPQAKSPQERLALYVGIEGDAAAKTMDDVPGSHVLREFYAISPATVEEALAGFPETPCHIFELVKNEVIVHDKERDVLHYLPCPIPVDDLPPRDEVLEDSVFDGCRFPLFVETVVEPSQLADDPVGMLIEHMNVLEHRASGYDRERHETGSFQELVRDRDYVSGWYGEHFKEYLDEFLGKRCYDWAVRVFSPDSREAFRLAQSVGLALFAEGQFAVRRHGPSSPHNRQLWQALKEMGQYRPVYGSVNGTPIYSEKLARVDKRTRQTLAREFERAAKFTGLLPLIGPTLACRLLSLPVVRGNYYLKTLRTDVELGNRAPRIEVVPKRLIEVGPELDRPGTLVLLVDSLCKHINDLGVPGSGKTVGEMNTSGNAYEQYRIPSLIINPVKAPHRRMLSDRGAVGRDFRLYTAGRLDLSPFSFNLLEVQLPGTPIMEHIEAVVTVLTSAIEMPDYVPAVMYGALEEVYRRAGFRPMDESPEKATWPTMRDFVKSLYRVLEKTSYREETKDEIRAIIENRIARLCQGTGSQTLAAAHSWPRIGDFLRHLTLIECEGLSQEKLATLTLALVTFLRRKLNRDGPSKQLRLLIVIEEAPNLIGTGDPPAAGISDPRRAAARLLSKTIAEVRDLGAGIVVVAQHPGTIPDDIYQNLGTRFAFCVRDRQERDRVAGSMLLDPYQHEELARLPTGECFVFAEHLHRPVRVRCKDRFGDLDWPDDEKVFQMIQNRDWFQAGWEMRLQHVHARLRDLCNRVKSLWQAVDSVPRTKESERALRQCMGAARRGTEQAQEKLEDVFAALRLDRSLRAKEGEIRRIYGNEILNLFGRFEE